MDHIIHLKNKLTNLMYLQVSKKETNIKNKWDQSLLFNAFKVTFKLEYRMLIQAYLRNLQLKKD